MSPIYAERAHTVEPMQSLVKNIFDLDHCWMRGNEHNRWLFAAMGVAVQTAHWMLFVVVNPLGRLSTWF